MKSSCRAALRALWDELATAENEATRKMVLKLEKNDPSKYHSIVAKLRAKPHGRPKTSVRQALEFVEVMIAEENEVEEAKVVMLTKRQWINWHKRKEDMSKAQPQLR